MAFRRESKNTDRKKEFDELEEDGILVRKIKVSKEE